MKKLGAVSILLITLIISGCPRGSNVTPQPPVVTDTSDCQAACDRLNSLGCEEGRDIDMKRLCADTGDCDLGHGCVGNHCVATCSVFCRDTQAAGVWLAPSCVKNITSCDQIESCPLPEPKKLSF